MKDKGHIPDHCLVGEPSCADQLGDIIKIGRRGSLSFIVTVEGKQGHAAYPHKADNPIPKLTRLVERLSANALDNGNDHFDPLRSPSHLSTLATQREMSFHPRPH
jgi:succinyl-diaminopimelate desuccinylase